jgi:hypothetical protein
MIHLNVVLYIKRRETFSYNRIWYDYNKNWYNYNKYNKV